jgi:hypothetical protein
MRNAQRLTAHAQSGVSVLAKLGSLAVIAASFAVYFWWQLPSQETCRALTQEHNALPLSGNRKTPSLTLTYYQFQLAPCYREIMKKLDAAQATQIEEERLYGLRKAEEARRKAILNGDNGPKNGIFPSRAAYEAHEKEYAAELARLQSTEPCKSRLKAEADGRARFTHMSTEEQRALSDLIRENANDCR